MALYYINVEQKNQSFLSGWIQSDRVAFPWRFRYFSFIYRCAQKNCHHTACIEIHGALPADRVGNTVRENSWPDVMRPANTSHTPTHPTRTHIVSHCQTSGCAVCACVCELIYFRRCLLTLGVNGNCGRPPRYLKTTHTTLYAIPPCKHTHTHTHVRARQIYPVGRNLWAFLEVKHRYFIIYTS